MISLKKMSTAAVALMVAAGAATAGIDNAVNIGIGIKDAFGTGQDYTWNIQVQGEFLDDNTYVARFDFADATGLDLSLWDNLTGNEFVEYRAEGTNLRSGGAAQTVNLGFNVMAGFLNTSFTIDAADVAFAPLDTVTGSASAAVSLTSTNFGVDATLSPDAAGAYNASYNSGTAFTSLFGGALTATSLSTQNYNDSFSGPIAGSVGDIDAAWAFTLSAFDLASGTSTFTVVPAPASAALLGLGGLVAVRRRR
ncbi:MAG: VPLPA-CTERM sorting domain-containing protein [Phycisphaerales bacterium]